MLAELHGKVSRTVAWEDTLTEAVFGTLKYLPRRTVLGPVLRQLFPDVEFEGPDIEEATFEFWPRFSSGVEPDVVLTVGPWVIVVEAKAGAPFATGTTIDEHQLVGEWKGARARVDAALDGRPLQGPLLLAVTDTATEPEDLEDVRNCIKAQEGFATLSLAPDQAIRWVRWADIATTIDEAASVLATHERAHVEDLLTFLQRRGVRTVFTGFNVSQYEAVAEGTRAAEDEVFPAIGALAMEIERLLKDQDVIWGYRDHSVLSFKTKRLDRASDWPTTYLVLFYWPKTWPARKGYQVALVVLFNLADPKVEVGYFQFGRGAGDAKIWAGQAVELVDQLRQLPPEFELVLGNDDYARHVVETTPGDVETAWLAEGLTKSRLLRVQRTLPLEEIATAEDIVQPLLEIKTALEPYLDPLSGGAIYKSLLDAGFIEAAGGSEKMAVDHA